MSLGRQIPAEWPGYGPVPPDGRDTLPRVTSLAVIIHSLLSMVIIALVLMHSGKDAGLSGAFGVGQGGSSYGGSTAIVERNLTRVTIVAIILWTVTTYWLSHLL